MRDRAFERCGNGVKANRQSVGNVLNLGEGSREDLERIQREDLGELVVTAKGECIRGSESAGNRIS